ncbi:hypothetical protein [Nafulsella turpanensis]|uniref:hypothetical protein n=1 Tax=Nafulsella turpanensis TaxID=1265690 RepID=UPI00034CE9BE|nr:hypothetical protein [Nafulsella turpanensis]
MTRIFTILLFVVAIGLGYFLYDSIRTDINQERLITSTEERVIRKLKMIRDAQIAYQAVRGEYTDNWDSLLGFIDTGKMYIVQKRERVITLDYGADSTIVNYDTLGTVSVRDSLFNERKYPDFNLAELPIIPGSEGKRFELFADQITKGTGAVVDVFEVKDVHVINPERRGDVGPGPLRVGSRTEATTQGNWEF